MEYPDKANFLSKFPCFEGYLQELDSSLRTEQSIGCHGLDKKLFMTALRKYGEEQKQYSIEENAY